MWRLVTAASLLTLALRRALSRRRRTGTGTQLPSFAQKGCAYLDCNATSPIWPEVAAEMAPFVFTNFGNPSSDHVYGHPSKQAVSLARRRLAAMIGCGEACVLFTSCGSESDNHAVMGALALARKRGGSAPFHVVTSTIEHPAIQKLLEHLEATGEVVVTWVPVNGEGMVDSTEVVDAIREDTALVTVMHSNNEVGSINPIRKIATKCSELGVLMHTDAAQSVGKVPVNLEALGPVDMVTIVGHKFGAHKGVAALYVRDGVEIQPFLFGGGQEGGRRAGTENVLLLAGIGMAAEIVTLQLGEMAEHMATMRARLLCGLERELGAQRLRVNGPVELSDRLPNTLSVSIKGVKAAEILRDLKQVVAASAGAACHTGVTAPSGVLTAMGIAPEWAAATLRLSVGRHTTAEEVDFAIGHIVSRVREQQRTGDPVQ